MSDNNNSNSAPEVKGTVENNANAAAETTATQPNQEDTKLASRFGALSKRERYLKKVKGDWDSQRKAQEREIAEKRSQLEELTKQVQTFEDLKKQAKLNPVEFLNAAGVSLEDLVDFQLAGGKVDPNSNLSVKALKEEIEELRNNLTREKEEAEVNRLRKEQEFIDSTLSRAAEETIKLIKNAGDKYELINAAEVHQEVPNLVAEWYFKTGELLTPFEAADKIESLLEEEARKVFTYKKFKTETNEPTPKSHQTSAVRASNYDDDEDDDARLSRARKSLTLSNSMTPQKSVFAPDDFSEQALMERAKQALLRGSK